MFFLPQYRDDGVSKRWRLYDDVDEDLNETRHFFDFALLSSKLYILILTLIFYLVLNLGRSTSNTKADSIV